MTTDSNLVEARVILIAKQHGIVSVPTELGRVTAENKGEGWRVTRCPALMTNRDAMDVVVAALGKVPEYKGIGEPPVNWNGTVDIRV